ncbi:MAG: DUF4058 family protein [Prosthecobacter sp.]|uniref:DUF4058 family protein n=1 Tax=Prosthecobacter sp. TaxID=1965333 RepID=UPI0038FD7596
MNKNNPFPGMNPFLERFWPDVHTTLISYIRDAIAENLPLGLKARSEEQVTLAEEDVDGKNARADVAVVEAWKHGIAPRWEPAQEAAGGVIATEPAYVIVNEEVERWIEILDPHGRVITVIEILSPVNKSDGWQRYVAKRQSYLAGGVNVVEIDLLRGGSHAVAVPADCLKSVSVARTLVCVTRAANPARKEVYETPLREMLPNVRIPLRQSDADVILALQPLVDRCYRMGGYFNENHRLVPGPQLGVEDQAWVAEQVQAAGLS